MRLKYVERIKKNIVKQNDTRKKVIYKTLFFKFFKSQMKWIVWLNAQLNPIF